MSSISDKRERFRARAERDLEREAMQKEDEFELSAGNGGPGSGGGDLFAPNGGDEPPEIPEPSWRKPADVLRAMPRPRARFPTSFPALDAASRGGLPTGGLIVFQGGPDSGKTGMAILTAVKIGLEHDAPVWIYTSDNGAESTAIRVGLLLALDGEKLDQRDPDEIRRLDEALAQHRIFIVNDGADGMTLDRLLAEAEALDPDTPHILAVDSLQETPPGTAAGTTERDTVNANIRLLRRAKASLVPWLLLATSEVIKSAFAAGRNGSKPSTHPLAAGSDSAKISYAANMVVHLSGDPAKGPDFGLATVVKNKLGGGKPSFGLRLETPSLRLLELDESSVEAEREDREAAEKAREEQVFAGRVWRYLHDNGPQNGSEILDAMKPCREKRIREAIRRLGPRVATTQGPRNSKIYEARGGPGAQ